MKLLFTIAILLISIICNCQTIEGYTDQILIHLGDDKPKKAYSTAQKGIKDHPNSHELHLLMGRASERLGNLDDAFTSYTQAINIKPDFANAYMKRGSVYVKIKDINNCIADYSSAIKYAESDSLKYWAMSNRGTCYHYNQQLDLALKDQREVFMSDSMDIFNINNYATILDYFDPHEAIRQLKRMIEIDPEFMGSYVNLGFQLGELGEYDEAEKYLRMGLEKVPEDAYMLNNLGYSLFKQGKYDEAINTINKSIKMNSSNSFAYRNLGLIYLELKNMEEACNNLSLSLSYGFSKLYGDEVKKLHAEHCLRK